MIESKKEKGVVGILKEGLGYISQILLASIFPPIAKGAEMLMDTIEDRIAYLEKRLLRKLSSLLILWFGGVLLIFALFFFLREFLGWSNTAAFFSIGMMIFVIGSLLKTGDSTN